MGLASYHFTAAENCEVDHRSFGEFVYPCFYVCRKWTDIIKVDPKEDLDIIGLR